MDKSQPFYKLWWFWMIVCVILVLATMITLRQLVQSQNQGVMNLLGIESQQGRGPGNMTDEERQQMKEQFDNMSEEERQQMRDNAPQGGMPPSDAQAEQSN